MILRVNKLKSVATFVMIAVVASLFAPSAYAQPSNGMRDLGTLGGSESIANGVSADGSVVVGRSRNVAGRNRAFRWTASGGMQDLGTLGGIESEARGISADGSIVVGWARNASGWERAFRWTASGGMQDLGTRGGGFRSFAYAVSADGRVVVGYAPNAASTPRAFRWTASGGMQDLGTLGAAGTWAMAYGVSADGSVVVGWSYNAAGQQRAFRWTASGGMQDLGTLGGSSSFAYGASADGSVVVGYARNAAGRNLAFRWTASGGMQDLGTFGGSSSYAYGVSADGSVVVGNSFYAPGMDRAFRWTAESYMQDLGSLSGGWGSSALSVSANGSVVVGESDGRAFRWSGDTDGDGLLDDWEINGIPYTKSDGTQGRYILDSNGDGASDANWLKKDIFVEVDAMPGVPFSLSSLADVRAAFASAPVPAPAGVPGGLPGITLHTVVDEENVPFQASIDSSQMPAYRQQWFGKPTERTGPDSTAILAAKAKAYRYCLFANRMTYPGNGYLLGKASGIPGTTFSVTLGGLPWSVAEIERYLGSTFMHELGHTLGLCHGGGDHTHYKPNYISVMNYNFDELYRKSGGDWVRLPLDFSRESLGTLDETCLDENVGVAGSSLHTGVSVPYAHSGPLGVRVAKRLIIGVVPLDWNGDSATGSCVAEDVTWFPSGHPLNGGPTPGDALAGFADWPFLKYAVPPESPVQLSCAGTARVCDFTEELVIWQRLNLPPPAIPCPADFDGSTFLDSDDFVFFLEQFSLGCTSPGEGALGSDANCMKSADFDNSGFVDSDDFVAFIAAFEIGC